MLPPRDARAPVPTLPAPLLELLARLPQLTAPGISNESNQLARTQATRANAKAERGQVLRNFLSNV